jgi:1-phosphofructokinase
MGEHVMVFAPVPQLTVTLEQVGTRPELHLHAGGQGLWQARMIASLGVPVTFCAALGGEVGRALKPLIEAEGVRLRSVERHSDNGWYIHDRREGDSRSTIAEDPGVPLGRHELDELYALTLTEGLEAAMCVLSGPADPSVVPADIYQRLATDLKENGARVAVDLSGDHLAAALTGRPAFVKVSDEELRADGRADSDDEEAVVAGLRKLRADGAETVVVSRAEKPAVALLGEEVVRVQMPRLTVRDHHGAGDSLTAGAVAVLAQGGDLTTALRTGAAAGALNVTRHGLGSGRADAIRKLVERVELEKIS